MFYSLLCLVVALFTTTAYAQDSGGTQSLPYTVYFSGTSAPDGWTTLANDGRGPNWEFGTNGAYHIVYYLSAGAVCDDYLISPYFYFEAGKTYEVEATMHRNTNGPNEVSVVYGMGDDVTAFTTAGDLDAVSSAVTSASFTVDESGNYRVALHNTSPLDGESGGCYIPSLTVREVENTGGGDEPSGESFYQINWVDGSITDLGGWSAYSVAGESEFVYNAMPEYEVWFGASCAGTVGGVPCEIDDYLISPVLPFEAGKTYKITVALMYNMCQDIDVMHGNSLDNTGWTSIGKLPDCSQEAVNEMTFTATGAERIAFHAVAAANVGDCAFASVTIEETAGGSVEEPALTVPYSKNFDETGNMDGWTTEDANGDGATWTFYGEGSGVMIQNWTGSNDDYFISPAFALEAGQSYKVTVLSNCQMNPEAMEVYAGTGSDVSAYTQIGTLTAQMGENTDEITFTPSTAGNYKIAFRNNFDMFTMISLHSVAIDVAGGVEPGGALVDKDFTTDTDITDWTVIDTNGDGEWHFEDGISGITLTRSRGNDQDDWLISPAMALESGKSYIVSYSIAVQGNADPETVATAYGTAATAEAMTTAIGSESIAAGETVTRYYRITPATSGNYYLGFHATSPSSAGGNISILNVKVAESAGVIPVAPTGFAAQSDIQAGEVTLTWTNPSIDTESIALTGTVMTRIVRNGVTVTDVEGQAGAAMSYVDTPEPFEGEATYQIMSYVTADKIGEAAKVTINLEDFQGEAHELYSWGGTYGGTFTTDWTVINANGGNTWTSMLYNDSWQINYGKPSDDWLISPAVSLTANRRYVIEIEVRSGINQPATIELYTGRGNTANDMTNLVQTFDCEGNGAIVYTTDQFGIDEDGTYYLGVRATNISTQTTLLRYTIYYYENTTGPEELPYTEAFDDSSLSGWSLPAGSTFAVTDGALASTGNGAERNETIFSPLIEFKAGYTYEVTFDYAFNGAAESALAFYMAGGQSATELIADSRTELSADGTQCRYMFTPAADGTYCAAWQLTAGADDDATAQIDNLAIGVNIYTTMPYNEDFNAYEAGELPFGYVGLTTFAENDGNIAAEFSSNGGRTPWFICDSPNDTYTATLRYKKSDYSGWVILTVDENGDEEEITSFEGDASTDWIEASFTLSANTLAEPHNFYLMFETFGEGTLQIDDFVITRNERAIVAAAPTNFRVYLDKMVVWEYPTTDADGNPLESTAQVTVTMYDGDQVIATQTGEPGAQGIIERADISDEWTNDTKLMRAVSSIGDATGGAATWILRMNDDQTWSYNGNIAQIASFGFTGDDAWTNDGWTIADGEAVATTGTPVLTSPSFDLAEGQLYLVRYYIATDADAAADFTVAVDDMQQVFTGAYIGKNTYDWSILDPNDPNYRLGKYMYIDFLLPRIEVAGTYNVEISASNIGSRISVETVEVYEVREYEAECAVPYSNDFDDLAVESGTIEPNWTRPFNTNPWRIDEMANYGEGLTAASGTRALIAPSTSELASTSPLDYIYTPYFIIEEGKDYVVEFDYYMPSADTGLAFVWALAPTYTEGEYAIIEELQQATEWTHYELSEAFSGSGSLVFGFVSYATEVRDMITAIDNFKIYEYDPVSAADVEAKEAVYYHDGLLNVPAGVALVTVYDMQGRTVMNTTETGEVSVEGLADGIYVVKAVNAGGAVQTLKFIK